MRKLAVVITVGIVSAVALAQKSGGGGSVPILTSLLLTQGPHGLGGENHVVALQGPGHGPNDLTDLLTLQGASDPGGGRKDGGGGGGSHGPGGKKGGGSEVDGKMMYWRSVTGKNRVYRAKHVRRVKDKDGKLLYIVVSDTGGGSEGVKGKRGHETTGNRGGGDPISNKGTKNGNSGRGPGHTTGGGKKSLRSEGHGGGSGGFVA